MSKKKLAVVMDPPTPDEVLYVHAAGGAGRMCLNCVLYDDMHEEHPICTIHGPSLDIEPDAVCGYHVLGEPAAPRFDEIDYVDPELSGLVHAPEQGTKCGNCVHFFVEARVSYCGAVTTGKSTQTSDGIAWEPAKVEVDGCCSRWKGKPERRSR